MLNTPQILLISVSAESGVCLSVLVSNRTTEIQIGLKVVQTNSFFSRLSSHFKL